MISERALASAFPGFWRELLPMLTPSLVHILSAAYEERLTDDEGIPLGPVEASEQVRDAAVVSEFAYHLARGAYAHGLSARAAYERETYRREAEVLAINLISRYEGRRVLQDAHLNGAELDEGMLLATRYDAFARVHGGSDRLAFQMPVKGCGFLANCAIDLAVDDCLIEVKTVKRSLAGKDYRQLFVYLALSSADQIPRWKHAGFLNPRRSTFHRFDVAELLERISGGRPEAEVFDQLLGFVCATDAQLDAPF